MSIPFIDDDEPPQNPLKARVEELERALRARDELLAIASHELKTPLTSLLLHVQRLRLMEPGAQTAPVIRTLERQCRKLVHFTNQVLTFAGFQLGQLELQADETDLNELVDDIVRRFRLAAEDKGSSIVWERPSAPLLVRCDPTRMEQAIGNLLDNAIKYGEGKLIVIATEIDSKRVSIVVQDQGRGSLPRKRSGFSRSSSGWSGVRVSPARGSVCFSCDRFCARMVVT